MGDDVDTSSLVGARGRTTGCADDGVWRLTNLPRHIAARWKLAAAGQPIHQQLGYARAVAEAHGADRILVVVEDGLLGVFRVQQTRTTSVFAGVPALPIGPHHPRQAAVRSLAEAVRRAAQTEVVYFAHVVPSAPVVASRDGATTPIRARGGEIDVTGMASWPRLPNPIIDWRDGGTSHLARARSRHGSRAMRQWRRFDSAGFCVATVTGESAVAALSHVEHQSWKAQSGQSMHHRDRQFHLYADVLRRRLAELDVAYDGDRPIAYRLDARSGDTVTCLKWSYDEQYRRHSPGFFLMTTGLVRRWGGQAVTRIDLFGSPDPLKDLLATDDISRVDLAWPPGPRTEAVRIERQAHDQAGRANHQAGHGPRRLHLGGLP